MRAMHPGEILKDELDELNLSANAFAKVLDVPPNRITSIINEQRGISADTAIRLARFFGTTPDFWMTLQSKYVLRKALASIGRKIDKKVKTREMMAA